MCGICGKYSVQGVPREEVKRMADSIAHRGPDDDGYYINGCIGLGHRRLSIIDLSTGRQPLSNEDESIWIVFNGEIYNYPKLKKELLSKGHEFKTSTDTEVIVHLYEEMGDRCVEKLNGMFAFAIWDQKQQKLLLARDRIGQKPLFYFSNEKKFLFGSEIKAILAADDVPRRVNLAAVHHYLTLRFIPAPLTMFEGIEKLPAGHILTYRNGKANIKRYWDLDFNNKITESEPQYLQRLENQLLATVDSHMISDVPVGAFLSGGMDTSTIVALMGQLLPTPFKTFAIGVKEQDYSELGYAKMVAERYQTHHVEEIVSANLISLMPKIVWHMDEPSDPIAACMYQAARLASQNVKVVLGGDGGDELFAGFDRYLGVGLIDYYKIIPAELRHKMFRPIFDRFSDTFSYKSMVQKIRWIDQLADYSGGQRYAEATAFFRFNHNQKEKLFNSRIWDGLKKIDSNQVIVDQYDKENASDPIDKMLYADFMTRLSEHTLMLTDRMNMAFSLEARSPFLDHELVELMAKYPSKMKINGRQLKYILRKFSENRLPKEILARKKQGFMFPMAYWFRNELYEFLKSFLDNSYFLNSGIINKNEVFNLIESHHKSRVDNHVRLWMLLNLEVWHQLYIENNDSETIQKQIITKYGIRI
jgi:asparagine synthase (glutamine-hydrolysing)